MTTTTKSLETVEPVGMRVLVMRDEFRRQTKAGLHLPDNVAIPTVTGRLLRIGDKVQSSGDYPSLREFQRVIFTLANAVPVDFEDGPRPRFVIPVEDIVAVISKES